MRRNGVERHHDGRRACSAGGVRLLRPHRVPGKYGFGESIDYFVRHDGNLYDSKAIAGAAVGVRTGTPEPHTEFSGGDMATARLLRSLGFTVTQRFDWTGDEIVLACELVYRNGWNGLHANTTEVQELSAFLQRLPTHPPDRRSPKFRNPNGVQRKTYDLASQHPDYAGTPTRGGRADKEVLAEFIADPAAMLDEAAAIREAVAALVGDLEAALPEPDLGNAPAMEGGVREVRHLTRERDPKLRKRKIAAALKAHGRIAREACGFDFAATYGTDRGREFIECHHTKPLSETGQTETRPEDLALLCSNCHRMIHVRPPWLTVDELRSLLRQVAPEAEQ